MRITILYFVLAIFGLVFPTGMAQAEPWSWGDGAKPGYIIACKTNTEKNKAEETQTRHRICSQYIQRSYGEAPLPETALFLRERLISLIDNYGESADFAYTWYHRLVMAALALALFSAGFTWWKGASTERLAAIGALTLILVTTIGAFGYNVQFKAHFTAARKLTVEKDKLELALITAAATKAAVDTKITDAAAAEYQKIIAEHTEAFGGAFTPPTIASLLPR